MIDRLFHAVLKTGFATLFALAGLTFTTLSASSADWNLAADDSKVAFGSIKKNTIGEVHHFTGLTGSVAADGTVSVEIDVTTIETFIDIRNERFLEYVFAANAPKAVLSAKIDMGKLEALKPGETIDADVEGTLTFNANDVPIEATMFIARLADDKVMVTTDEMIMVSMEDLGVQAGVDALQKIAKLPGITRVSPVTLRLVFTR